MRNEPLTGGLKAHQDPSGSYDAMVVDRPFVSTLTTCNHNRNHDGV